jgi:hypothetical protein
LVNQRNRYPARRRFLKQSAALSAQAAIPAGVVLAGAAAAKSKPKSESATGADAAPADRTATTARKDDPARGAK